MPGALAAQNEVLAKIDDVSIDPTGRYKYILVKVMVDGSQDSKLIIRGTVKGFYHADILDLFELDVKDYGVTCDCLGGGKIEHDSDGKNITVFGISEGFGKADHSIAVKLLKEKYPDYNCITEKDVY